MWAIVNQRSASASESPPPPPSSHQSQSSTTSTSSLSFPPVVSYHVYSENLEYQEHQHHQQGEFCHSSEMDGSYNYTEVEIESSRVRVVRSQLSQIRSAVASRLSPGWWISNHLIPKPSRPSSPEIAPAATTSSNPQSPAGTTTQRRVHMQDEISRQTPQGQELLSTASRSGGSVATTASHRQAVSARLPLRRTDWDRDSGVDWRFGGHGMSMIFDAESKGGVPELERSSYISGVRDMLRGLPNDLTQAEAAWILSQKMPKAISDLTAMHAHPHSLPPSAPPNFVGKSIPTAQRNLIHQLVLPVIETVASFLRWIVPIVYGYAVCLAGELARLEKEHHYGERVILPVVMWGLNWLGLTMIWLGNAFPGQMIWQMVSYLREGLVGAVGEFMEKESKERVDLDRERRGSNKEWEGIRRMAMQGILMGSMKGEGMEMGSLRGEGAKRAQRVQKV